MAKMSKQEKLIRDAESFAAGCSRSRLELRLVDEIHRLNGIIDRTRDYVDCNVNVYGDEIDPDDILTFLGEK